MKNKAIKRSQRIKAIISDNYYRHNYRCKSKKANISTIFIIGTDMVANVSKTKKIAC